MGRYEYTDTEKDINKVFRMNQERSKKLKNYYRKSNNQMDSCISSSEQLLKELGLENKLDELKNIVKIEKNPTRDIKLQDWDQIVDEANDLYKHDIELEDILSKSEFEESVEDYKRIKSEFSKKIKLNKIDISFLIIATALQTIRTVIIGELCVKLDSIDRMDDKAGDKLVKEEKKKFCESHKNWEDKNSSKGYKTWKEIILTGVPYDATKGSPTQGINMGGKYHRYKTLGHDPILGWVFGTSNIITSTITLNNFNSYRVENMAFTSKNLLLNELFIETYESINEDINRLPAAIFRQALHLKSDVFTKLGLPVPMIGAFSEEFSGKLYKSQYDSLCLAKDSAIGVSSALSIMINMIIGLVHGIFYDEIKDGSREFYEARTRKILMYSNCIASTSNIISVYITKNPKRLDIGGLLVTVVRMFSDVRFITKLQDEFISKELDKGLNEELEELDKILKNYNKI